MTTAANNRAFLAFNGDSLGQRERWVIVLENGETFDKYPTQVKALIDARKYGLKLAKTKKYRIVFETQLSTEVFTFESRGAFGTKLRQLTKRDHYWGFFNDAVIVNAKNPNISGTVSPDGIRIKVTYGTFSANGENVRDTIGGDTAEYWA